MSRAPLTSRLSAAVVATTLVAAGCASPLDTTRAPVDTGSFGTTVLTLVCKRFAYADDLADGGATDVRGDAYRDVCREGLAPPDSASDRMKALAAERDRLITTVDTIFPDDYLAPLQGYLTQNDFLALYDDDRAQGSIDALIGMLRLMADDPAVVGALERLGPRIGYRPLRPALGAVRALVRYPELNQLLLALTTAITEGGSARGEWKRLINAVGGALRAAQPSANPGDPDRTLRVALDLLLRERATLGTSATVPLTLRDARGLAQPVAIAAPFVDRDGDGAADVDGQGRFVDGTGAVIDAPTPFDVPTGEVAAPWPHRDSAGRALTAAGGPALYRYVDLDATVLAALARDGIALFDPGKGTALDLLRGASALVGPRQAATHTYANGETLDYRGYDTAASPLLDLGYAYSQLLADPGIGDTLALGRELAVNHEPEVARLAEAVVKAFRAGDGHPEAQVPVDAPLWDDLVPVLRQIAANPALFTALMTALEKPEVAQLGERFRTLMAYKDRFDINPANQTVTGSFATQVDRSRPDSSYDRSIFQRFLHLINDSNGARACNKQGARVRDPFLNITLGTYNECALFRVDNLAVFYLQSMAYAKDGAGNVICEDAGGEFNSTRTAATAAGCAGFGSGWRPRPKANFNYNWGGLVRTSIDTFGGDGFLEDTVGIAGMRSHPTPEALNRVLFLNPTPAYLTNIIDPLRDKEGDLFISQHAGTLPVLEKDGFYAQMRPVVQAFADQNAEQLLVDILAVLHKHWPSRSSINHQSVDPAAPSYVWGSGAVSYEALIVDILADGSLMSALAASAPTLDAITVRGKRYPAIVRAAVAYLLTPRAGLADRTGRTTTTTADGRAVGQLSPWHLLADAYRGKQARLGAAGSEGEAWTQSVSELVDVLARGADVPGQGWRWKNPRLRGVLDGLLELLEQRVAVHDAAGDRARWLATDLPADMRDLVTSPVFAGAADFVVSLQAEPETRVQLDKVMQYLVSEAQASESFVAALTAIADVAQLALDDADLVPIAHVLGQSLAPERGWLEAHLAFVKGARTVDAAGTLARLMTNLYDEARPDRTAVGELVDGLTEVLRANPYQDLGEPLTAADYRSILTGVADFLDEEQRGLRKFIAIIKSRNL
ncbi:MAG: hypothetical protein R3B06_18180 [Kofleriaceae bacterium]